MSLRLKRIACGLAVASALAAGSAAAERGLKVGDTILEVAGSEVNAPSEVRAALMPKTGHG